MAKDNKQSNGYKFARHFDQVVKSSAAKGSARTVLMEAIRRSDFDKPETTFTKDQICDVTLMSRRTLMRALALLRDEGSLVPIRNHAGGKGNATTYSVRVVGQGPDATQRAQEGRGADLDDERARKFRALSRKFGAIKALDLMGEP